MTDRQPAAPAAAHALVGLCLLTLTCHLGLIRAGFVYDDTWTILNNSTIRSFDAVPALLSGELAKRGVPDAWRPLMVMSHMLDYQLFGLRARGYHLHSLAWHLGCVLLLWLLILRLSRRPLLALTSAALFAVHPIHVEVVAAINYREDLLATFFTLAALLALFRPAPANGELLRRGPAWIAAAALALLGGLAAKETAAVAPALFLVLCFAFATEERPLLRRALPGALALAVAVTLYAAWRLGTTGSVSPYAASMARPPWPTYAEATLRTLAQLVVPVGLSPEYPQLARAWASGIGVASLLGVLAVVGAALWSAVRGARLVAAGLAWLLLAWLPTSGVFFAMPNARADRYAYLPSVGACVLAAALLGRISRPRLRLVVSATIVVAFGVLSAIQCGVWRSQGSVWRRAVAVAPRSARAWTGLARAEVAARDLAAARRAGERAVALAPASGTAHLVLANIYVRLKLLDRALRHYGRAARLPLRHPAYLYTSWGYALLRAGRTREAEAKLRRALALAPGLAQAHANLARVLARTGRTTAARAAMRRARELAPERAARFKLPARSKRAPSSPEPKPQPPLD